jgi:hypothetical protein
MTRINYAAFLDELGHIAKEAAEREGVDIGALLGKGVELAAAHPGATVGAATGGLSSDRGDTLGGMVSGVAATKGLEHLGRYLAQAGHISPAVGKALGSRWAAPLVGTVAGRAYSAGKRALTQPPMQQYGYYPQGY